MTVPSNAYAVTYRISLHDHTGVDPVAIVIETTFPFSSSAGISPSPVVVAEDAAATTAMRAWEASGRCRSRTRPRRRRCASTW